jgi:hypothetical protein
MTTTIGPALGHGLSMSQQGIGATPGYDAIDARRFWSAPELQEGVLTAGSFEVVQRGAGANMSVDIAASTGDGAIVKGDAVTAQGLYFAAPHTAVINEVIAAADATNPRIDQVILEIKDNQHDASGSNLVQTRVVTGTPTVGATLANRTGAAALPASALRLADVLVGAAAATVTNSVIRDRRTWARGAYVSAVGDNTGNHTTSSTSFVEITQFAKRIECSGTSLEVTFRGRSWNTTAAAATNVGVVLDTVGTPTNGAWTGVGNNSNVLEIYDFCVSCVLTPSAGSHVVRVVFNNAGTGTGTISNNSGLVSQLIIREIVRPNTVNNITTSG